MSNLPELCPFEYPEPTLITPEHRLLVAMLTRHILDAKLKPYDPPTRLWKREAINWFRSDKQPTKEEPFTFIGVAIHLGLPRSVVERIRQFVLSPRPLSPRQISRHALPEKQLHLRIRA